MTRAPRPTSALPGARAPGPDAAAAVFLTQAEVATLLRISPRTLEDWRLTRTGPPYVRLGRHVRYELAEVVAWARSCHG